MTFRFDALSCCAVLVIVGTSSASAAIITQWTFENQPISGAPPYDNSPTPSTATGLLSCSG